MPDIYFDRRKCKSLKVIERDFDEFCFTVFLEDRDISFICVVKKHMCILLLKKLVYLLKFMFIIVYCDSISKSHNLFVISEEKT